MLILMDCRPLFAMGTGSERSRLILSATAMVSNAHGVRFQLLVEQGYDPGKLLKGLGAAELPAGFSVLEHRSFPGRAGWRIWYDWLIPRLARKHGADAIFLTGGIAAAPSRVPQFLWMPEKADPTAGGDRLPLYSRRLKESLSRASLVFCFSETDREWLGGFGASAAVVAPWAFGQAPPFSSEQREAMKQQYANGREYFLADVSNAGDEKITRLLKSFSLFKKRQLSNLQLILAGSTPTPGAGLQQRLETYKYREEVGWVPQQAGDGDRLRSAAYAFLFPFAARTLGVPVLDAWRSEVPVITGRDTGLQQWVGDAALVADMEDPASLAAHMMTVYKDERLRAELIEKGRRRLAAYTPQQPVDAIWAGLARVIRQPAAGSM
ncbi:MAG: glycosyltransferase [Bacteroidetes bacterium]|nr:glycosyltransferase [Bacteroidota bacterium]